MTNSSVTETTEAASLLDRRRSEESTNSSVAARGTIQLLVARGVYMVSAFVVTIIAARQLGPADYGMYAIVMSVLVWIEIVASAGIPGAISRLLPRFAQQAAAFEQAAVGCLFTVSLVVFCLSWSLAPTLAQVFNVPGGSLLFRIAFLDIPFNSLYLAYQGILNGYRQFRAVSAALILYGITKLGGIIIVFFVLEPTITGLLVVNVAATVATVVYCTLVKSLSRTTVDYRLITQILRVSVPYTMILGCRQVLSNLDLWSLQNLGTDPHVMGVYVASTNIPRMLLVIPNTISDVLFASLAWALVQNNEELAQKYIRASMRFVLVVLCPCCVLLFQGADSVMTLLYSDSYAAGDDYLRIQIIAVIPQAVLGIIMVILAASEKYVITIVTLLFSIVVALLLNIILIPRLGGIGAAIAVLLTNSIGASVAAVCLYRRFGPMISGLTLARVIAATAVMVVVGQQLPAVGAGLLLKSIAFVAGYILLLALTNELKPEDLRGFALWSKDT
jgi:O-antigen/teichoic acid export membrane protein